MKQFEQRLRNRQDKGEFWWELRACDYYQDFENPKVIVQCIAYYAQFAFDPGRHYVNNKVIVIPTNDLYVLGILNSRVMWWIVNRTFQHMKDEGLSVDVQFLKRLPIPVPKTSVRSEIEALTRELVTLATGARGQDDRRFRFELKLNDLVLDAFQLADERKILEASLPLRDPIDSLTDQDELEPKAVDME